MVCPLAFSLSIKITIDSWLHLSSHKCAANQGLSKNKGHRNIRTCALNPNHGQADHQPLIRQDLLARKNWLIVATSLSIRHTAFHPTSSAPSLP
jgi:hypothetical protein